LSHFYAWLGAKVYIHLLERFVMQNSGIVSQAPSIKETNGKATVMPRPENLSDGAKLLQAYDTNKDGYLGPKEVKKHIKDETIRVFDQLKENALCADVMKEKDIKGTSFPQVLEKDILRELQKFVQSGITSPDAKAAFPKGVTAVTSQAMQDVASPIIMREINACLAAKPKVSR
jgi:hypothetical protein